MPSRTTTRGLADGITCLVFALAIGVPAIATIVGHSWGEGVGELRQIVPPPSAPTMTALDLTEYPLRLRRYFKARVAVRAPLIRLYDLAMVVGLNTSPVDRVILGRDRWLYYTGDGAISVYCRTDPLTPVQVNEWSERFEAQGRRLKKLGAKYVVLIAPSKETIYPEYMPARFARQPVPSRLDQLKERLAQSNDLMFVDVRPALLAEKAHYIVYDRTDSHWNDIGAHTAYAEIFKQATPLIGPTPSRPLSDYSIAEKTGSGGDLAEMLGLESFYTERYLRTEPHFERAWSGTDMAAGIKRPAGLPKVILFGDSFSLALAPFVAESANPLIFRRQIDIDWDLVQRTRPTLVIQEIVERRLSVPNTGT